jgi:AAA15 family ATPase/GTPase
MLLRFGVKNHLSIRDYQELSCVASAGYEDLPHTFSVEGLRQKEKDILPVLAIYGANAAGKSNILSAISFFGYAISRSYFWEDEGRIPHEFFSLDSISCEEDSLYDCDLVLNGIRYQYGFSLTKEGIKKEWLYAYPKGVRNILFQRDFTSEAETNIYFGPSLKGLTPAWKKISENSKALMLSAAGRKESEHDQLSPIFHYFSKNLNTVRINDGGGETDLADAIHDENTREKLVNILRMADFGIVGVEITVVPIPEEAMTLSRDLFEFLKGKFDKLKDVDNIPIQIKEKNRIHFRHAGYDGKTYLVRYDNESSGTKYLAKLLVPVMAALENGSTLVVDEITTNLHTKISEGIVQLFTSPELNKKHAQFIFSTHDTNLLSRELLRRDEIWFAEKTAEGATSIYPLSDFKTRKSDNVEKGYLQGRFGAIPFVGDIGILLS